MKDILKLIFQALQFCLLQLKSTHVAFDGLLRLDFEIDSPRKNLMIICFSHLADTRWWFLLILIWLIGPIGFFQLGNWLNFNFLFDGRIHSMWVAALIGFIFYWLFRRVSFWMILCFLLINQGEIHINLATTFILGVLLSRSVLLWWMRLELVSAVRKTWNFWSTLNLATSVFSIGLIIFYLDAFHAAGYFSNGLKANRSEFILTFLFFWIFLHLIVSSFWGHFWNLKKPDPANLKTRFSSAQWLLRIQVSPKCKLELRSAAVEAMGRLLVSQKQYDEIKSKGLVSGLDKMGQVLQSESSFLQIATSRLTVD